MDTSYDDDSSSAEIDMKPIFFSSPSSTISIESVGLYSSLSSGSKKWSPCSLQDANRKSAFLPYRQHSLTCNTVLTNLQRGNTQSETPIPHAAEVNFHMKAGQGELVEKDIENRENVDLKDCNGLTALHWACAYGQVNTVQILVAHGANVNELGPEEESPLILAASGGHHDVVKLLINHGAMVNHMDHMCNTSLMYAAKGNHPHTCQELLSHGADFSLPNLNDDNAHQLAIANNSTLAQAVIEGFISSKLEASSDGDIVQVNSPEMNNDYTS